MNTDPWIVLVMFSDNQSDPDTEVFGPFVDAREADEWVKTVAEPRLARRAPEYLITKLSKDLR